MVTFWKWIEQEDEETGEIIKVPFLRYYSVFHIDQCEEISAKYAQVMPDVARPDETADKIINGYVTAIS